ncbi:Aldo-keto reductase family 1 member B10 [Apostichopus japonicus]|uniref:Aldo-keto reductase family 1 member B10 n=1 Tax=Stichopus japonicus TaxID=307972 RepID=A0A2G8LRI1_STIJA|nr:Aldo-keto reductase family 1 member B10 [Apostichopus japonicus]
MEPLVEKGLAKSIGVSNVNLQQLGEILRIAKVPCVNNQIENHPFLDQTGLIKFSKENNVSITAFGPLGSPERPWAPENDKNLRNDPVVKKIADSRKCTPVQILIAYNLSQGLVCAPKSTCVERIEENFKVISWCLVHTSALCSTYSLQISLRRGARPEHVLFADLRKVTCM